MDDEKNLIVRQVSHRMNVLHQKQFTVQEGGKSRRGLSKGNDKYPQGAAFHNVGYPQGIVAGVTYSGVVPRDSALLAPRNNPIYLSDVFPNC